MMKSNLFFIVLICLFFVSCSQDDENLLSVGIQTRVTGKITDSYNSPIPNVKLKISEYKLKPNNSIFFGNLPNFIQHLESSQTNSNGEYNFTFKTSGQGNFYSLEIEPSPISEQKYWNCCVGLVPIKNIGENFIFNTYQLVNLYPCDVTFNLNNISNLPLQIIHETTRFDNNTAEINSNSQVVKRIYLIKYNMQTIKIFRTKNGITQKASYTFPASNVETLTTQNITIYETDFTNI
ncbi:carboxypeptidase-like regulatory domain-containing protein [Flavobacterium sp. K5-23]|uniref:carboxypeptidase-like regulatory domain-containing protein n=1 Tax=Flavobacterium sp. K5-23 TaxID=2746225 RepID=UPI00200DE9D6|nr:carboxypeptidase-like regulatory domain-containing protein [Flavobacterium sp. K5-23]UQD57142.1 carboxypeptidase regulatory-like domain-containing protein [Flavobacterium sp. K5-23]